MRVHFAEFILDTERRQLARGAEAIHLSPKAFDVLCLLVEKYPHAVNKSEVYDRVWPGTFVVDANLAVLVAEIRRALDDDPRQPRFIRTVHRFGYAFCSDVAEAAGVPLPGQGQIPTKIWLVWNDRVLMLAQGDNLVGRDPACPIWLDAAGVSRRHARIVVTGTAAVVEDLGSKNGTFIDAEPVTASRPIQDGDTIHVGPVALQFRAWSDAGGSETVRLSKT